MSALITDERAAFHQGLIASGTLVVAQVKPKNAPAPFDSATFADASSPLSVRLGLDIASQLGVPHAQARHVGQSAGTQFERAVQSFLASTFPRLSTLRPGDWQVNNVGGARNKVHHLAKYDPYRHLDDLAKAIDRDPTLASVLGNSYEISPDVIVIRNPEADATINSVDNLVDGSAANLAPLRSANQPHGIVHAVISCKWTLRSDRAQNARSEALNIIRNRKGRTPHIAVVTAEPTPFRLASLALGTGDLDTVYHFALPELLAATKRSGDPDAVQMLDTLVDGRRLRDIADLPLDLAV
ncbi:NgoMIV family type II restriction endonuclease [Microbacterium sp. BWT-B31]|uniref:NgoMIV family type II restriction endonuclease n=1 Tax=Microbacterium sp. BWT-B31 TaxID=3232072 RepID=UPI0035290665